MQLITRAEQFSRAYLIRFDIAPTRDRIEGRISFQFRNFIDHAAYHSVDWPVAISARVRLMPDGQLGIHNFSFVKFTFCDGVHSFSNAELYASNRALTFLIECHNNRALQHKN